jgi:hypothetical protein
MWFVVCVGCADRFIADDGIGIAVMLCDIFPSVYIDIVCEHSFTCAHEEESDLPRVVGALRRRPSLVAPCPCNQGHNRLSIKNGGGSDSAFEGYCAKISFCLSQSSMRWWVLLAHMRMDDVEE